jgi:hypothetical protein
LVKASRGPSSGQPIAAVSFFTSPAGGADGAQAAIRPIVIANTGGIKDRAIILKRLSMFGD